MNLWKQTTSLNFDAHSALRKKLQQSSDRWKLLKSETRKYVKWVNSITRWVDFAFARQVERLELDLHNYSKYPFSGEFLFDRSRVRAPGMVVDFKNLKALTLKCVAMTGADIEYILNNCPLLERLVVHLARRMSNLEVCGSSLVLKHLEIVDCWDFISLNVSAPSLTSLVVKMFEELSLENVPILVEVSVRCYASSISVKRLFSQLSCCISQLEILCLELQCELYGKQEPIELCDFSEMPKLKKLIIECNATGDESLVRLTALMRAFPYLEEFVLKYKWHSLPRKDRPVKVAIIRSPHNHLKVLTFCGYYGRTSDAELLDYILENCVALEKITVDHSGAFSPDTDELDVEQTARKNAKQLLEPLVPRHVQLVIV